MKCEECKMDIPEKEIISSKSQFYFIIQGNI